MLAVSFCTCLHSHLFYNVCTLMALKPHIFLQGAYLPTLKRLSTVEDKSQILLFVKLTQDVRNKIPMLLLEDTTLLPASRLTNGILTYVRSTPCCEQTNIVVTAKAREDTYCQVSSSVISTLG